MSNLFRFPGATIDAAGDQYLAVRTAEGKYYRILISDLVSNIVVDGTLIPSITDNGTTVAIDADLTVNDDLLVSGNSAMTGDLDVGGDLAVTGAFTAGGDTIGDLVGAALPSISDNGTTVAIDAIVVVTGNHQELTASGAVTAGMQSVELNHATVAVAATIADAANHPGLFIVKDTSASGTAGHSLKLTAGTFDGTNNTVTFNAPKDALAVYFDSAGKGTILVNVGAAALSST